jgi:hypothetical protein
LGNSALQTSQVVLLGSVITLILLSVSVIALILLGSAIALACCQLQ